MKNLLMICLLLCSAFVAAESAHVHGEAQLNIYYDKQSLQISLLSPAQNIVGFEHHAQSHKDIAQVKQAQALLEKPSTLLAFKGAPCVIKQSQADMSALFKVTGAAPTSGTHNHHHEPHSHHSHTHHHKVKKTMAAHGDIEVNYHFACQSNTKILAFDVRLFEQFSQLEKIHAVWVTPSSQGGKTLTKKNPRVNLNNAKDYSTDIGGGRQTM